MARVRKVLTPKECKCGREPKVCQWTDTKPANATWIECECGMMTRSFHGKDANGVKDKAIKMWNKTARRRKIKGGLRSCEKCGSNDVQLHEFKHNVSVPKPYSSFMVFCEGCGLCTDEMNDEGHILTKEEAKELWNI